MKCCQSVLVGLLVCVSTAMAEPRAANVILFIGDGMGPEQVRAASYYATGRADGLVMHTLPHHGLMTTHSANNSTTDSAASATAFATGVKVNNHVISVQRPGDGHDLPTILEHFKQRGALTGLVTTDSLLGATPAGFSAHQEHRNMILPIAADILRKTQPNVMFGGGGAGMNAEAAKNFGYTVATTREQLINLFKTDDQTPHLAGIFGGGRFDYYHRKPQQYVSNYPRLYEMTAQALAVLSRSEKGFFLMVESALIDKSGHSQRLDDDALRTRCNITETLELDKAVHVAVDFARVHPDTLIIVTADHECGDLHITQTGSAGQWPTVRWGRKDHTGIPVPIFATGPDAERCAPKTDNAEVFNIMAESAGLDIAAPAATR